MDAINYQELSVLDLCKQFKTVHDAILKNGCELALVKGSESPATALLREFKNMVAIVNHDGSLELAFRHKGQVAAGVFPKMDGQGRWMEGIPACLDHAAKNLEVFQARLNA